MKNLKVLLADPRHTGLLTHSNYVPIGIGYIGSHLLKSLENKANIELELYTDPDEIFDRIEEWKPDIVGISNYMWNAALSNYICEFTKKIDPNILCVLGGPEFPAGTGARYIKNTNENDTFDKSFKYLLERPCVDYFAWSDGEVAFTEIVERFIDANYSVELLKSKNQPIKGSASISKDKKKLLVGDYFPRIGMSGSIKAHGRDIIPSPYTSGLLDKFLDGKFIPCFETARGCPFMCTFCDQGLDESKMTSHSNLRMYEELMYVGERVSNIENGQKHVEFFDSNWGMFNKDLEFAEDILKVMNKYDWPEFIEARAPKSNRENILKINDMLKNRVRFGLSMQSLNIETLTDIKRRNWTTEEYIDFLDELKKRGKTASSEMIIPLPGETVESYFEGQKFLMNNNVQPDTYTLMLLCGAELGRDRAIKNYEMKSKFRLLPKGFGQYRGKSILELEQICVETNTMSFEGYLQCRNYSLLVRLLNHKLFEPIYKLTKKLNINWFDLIRAFDTRVSDKNFKGSLKDYYDDFSAESSDECFETEESLKEYYLKPENFKAVLKGEMGENLSKKYLAKGLYIYNDVVETVFQVIKDKLINKNDSETVEILSSAEQWLKNIHMIHEVFAENAKEKDKFDLNINFDFPAWLEKEELPLSKFKIKSTYNLSYNTKEVKNLRTSIAEQYGNDKQVAFVKYLSHTSNFGADIMQKTSQKKN